ncbi:hypothetical protein HK104_003235, partial [Borealophlyctis nickersoniae]
MLASPLARHHHYDHYDDTFEDDNDDHYDDTFEDDNDDDIIVPFNRTSTSSSYPDQRASFTLTRSSTSLPRSTTSEGSPLLASSSFASSLLLYTSTTSVSGLTPPPTFDTYHPVPSSTPYEYYYGLPSPVPPVRTIVVTFTKKLGFE